jgi:STE24 endopeptidase
MSFARRGLIAFAFFCLIALFAEQRAGGQTAPDAATAQTSAQPGQAYTLPPEKLAKAIALDRIRNILNIAGSIWDVVFLWLLLATRTMAALEAWARRTASRRWVQGALFFAVFLLLITVAALPLEVYGHHVGRSYGISVQRWGDWFGDQGKSLGLTLAIGVPVLLLFNWLVRKFPRRYWFAAWLITLPLMVLGMVGEPLVEPLFSNFEPLSLHHAELVAELQKVVARTGTQIPPERMFLMDASVKTNGLNAYVTGLGATKRIVVWDTTAGRIPDDQVMFIFGHESGHYVLNHIPKMMSGFAIALFFVFWACARIGEHLERRFGAGWRIQQPDDGTIPVSTRAGFVVLIFTLLAAGFVLAPAGNGFSRHFEHQADVYGQEAIHGLVPDPQKTAVASFQALGEAWLEDPDPNPFIEFWLYNHPSVKNRANFAAHYDPWANGGHGEFFDK